MLKSANLLHECGLGDCYMNSTVLQKLMESFKRYKEIFLYQSSPILARHPILKVFIMIFLETWKRFKYPQDDKEYGQQLLKAVVNYNSFHTSDKPYFWTSFKHN